MGIDNLDKVKKTLEQIAIGKIKSNNIEKILAITLKKVIEKLGDINEKMSKMQLN